MIKDKIKYAELYYSISENLKLGFEWLKRQDLQNMQDGKYIIKDKMYANIQTYETKADADYEAHNNYIDIQYIIDGYEFIGIADRNVCSSTIPYDKNKDIEFMTYASNDDYQLLNKSEFLLLFPTDAHKPSINPNKKVTVRKAVVKVPLN
ncbi:MAG: YhcH/YjgK/YiaL family protein [bacterium]|nr:YhcH/YjgK/YiaL family protein [bacterium]